METWQRQVVIYSAIVVAAVVVVIVIVKIYNKATTGVCHSYRSLRGKTVLITGANRGIGKEVALDMAIRDAKVILACRNQKSGKEVAEEIIKRTGNKKISARYLDVSSLFSVRKFAEEIIKKESRLDILIHNAGVIGTKERIMTADDIETTFATNYLGPFLLTSLLLSLLKKSAPSSIIFVCSGIYTLGKIDTNNLNGEKGYGPLQAYSNSKLAQIMYIKELAKKLVGSNVTVNCVNPGMVKTDIQSSIHFPLGLILSVFAGLFGKTPQEGAQPIIHAAVAKEVENVSGKYFVDCKIAKESSKVQDIKMAKELWEASERMTDSGPNQC